jgi:sterol desaturase/sphingolipid hydroxylase (fatty acid hydroxylase superfamily)
MLAVLLTILISYIATTLFGFVVHWSLHQPWAGQFNNSHMTHHLKLYPPEDYASEKYRRAGKDDTTITFAFASIPMIAFPIVLGLLGVLGWTLVITAVTTQLLLGFLHWYIHDTFHIKNHWMGRVPVLKDIFQVWNRLHYLHHVDMRKNYGIFVFHWDRIFGTFWHKTD